MLFSGVATMLAFLIVTTPEGEGIFKQPAKKNDKSDATTPATSAAAVGGGGGGGGGGAAPAVGEVDAAGADVVESSPSGGAYPSVATSGGYPSTAGPAGGTVAVNNRARTAGNALLGGLSGLVSRGVSKLTDGLHELSEARAAGRKVYLVLHPQTVKMEKIAHLMNWRVSYNTWLVVAFLVTIAVAGKLLPWWQVDTLLKLAFGYGFFVPGFFRWYRGSRGHKSPIDVWWMRLPHAATPRDTPVESAASVAARTARAETARHRADAVRHEDAPAAAAASATSSTSSSPLRAAAPVAESPSAHRKPAPARPPPPKFDDAAPTTPSRGDGSIDGEVDAASTGRLEAILADQEALGSWSAIHVNTKKKGTLQVLEKHIAILLPNARAPESVVVECVPPSSSSSSFALLLLSFVQIVLLCKCVENCGGCLVSRW
jgi:hypothetical protein